MNTHTAAALVILGIIVSLLGVIGYVSHPERAHTALIFGGGFGALSILWGILAAKGLRWSKPAAMLSAALFSVACGWRASLGWLGVASGQLEKVFASLVITLMLAVSAVMLVVLLKDRGAGGAAGPRGGVR